MSAFAKLDSVYTLILYGSYKTAFSIQAQRDTNMKNKTLTSVAFASLLSLGATQAQADYTTYFGFNGGLSGAQGDNAIKDAETASVYFGALKDFIGFEIGYNHLGKFEGRNGFEGGELKATAAHLALALRGTFVSKVDVYAKVGFHKTYWEADRKASGALSAIDLEGDNPGLTYQAGLYIPLASNIGLTGSWQIFNGIELKGKTNVNNIDVNTFRFGLEFVF